MKISIITVCKNMGKELEETIVNINNQTFKDIEYVIVDGDSSDNTKEIAEKYKTKIDKFVSEKDSGIFEAMNKGSRMVSGDYVYFLNAGDTLASSDVLLKVVKRLEKTKADILYGNIRLWQNEKNWINKFDKINRWFLVKNSICHQAVFTKREIFEKYGLFDQGYQIAGDYDWFIRSWNNPEITKEYCNITVANFILNGKSSSVKYRSKVLKECEIVRRKYFSFGEIFCYKMLTMLTKIKSWL